MLDNAPDYDMWPLEHSASGAPVDPIRVERAGKLSNDLVDIIRKAKETIDKPALVAAIKARDRKRIERILNFPAMWAISYGGLVVEAIKSAADAALPAKVSEAVAQVGGTEKHAKRSASDPAYISKWARDRVKSELLRTTKAGMQMIRDSLAFAFDNGEDVDPEDFAESLLSKIGLTNPQAVALEKFKDALKDEGDYNAAEIRALVAQRSHEMLTRRATVIANNEIQRAMSASQVRAWGSLKNDGSLDDGWEKEWQVTSGERACEICVPLDEMRVGMDEEFADGIEMPPDPHIGCECRVVLRRVEREEEEEELGAPVGHEFYGNQHKDGAAPGTPEREENFKRWFGNSKVVDKDGLPLTVYRGRRADSDKPQKRRATPSYTDDPDVANVYSRQFAQGNPHGDGSNLVPANIAMENPLDLSASKIEFSRLSDIVSVLPFEPSVERGGSGKIGYLDIADAVDSLESQTNSTGASVSARTYRNLYEVADAIRADGRKGGGGIDAILKNVSLDSYAIPDSKKWVDLLRVAGFDGVIHNDAFEAGARFYRGVKSNLASGLRGPIVKTYRPFSKSQVKSTTGNTGAFNPKDKRSTHGAPASTLTDSIGHLLIPKPEIKSATGNKGTFNPDDDDIRHGAPVGHEFYGNQHTDGGGVTDEKDASRPPKPGETFRVYRLGSNTPEPPLENVNGGNAQAVAAHLRGFGMANKGDRKIHAYDVTVDHNFGEYVPYGMKKAIREAQPTVGRRTTGDAVAYSFPKGSGYTFKHIGSIPVEGKHVPGYIPPSVGYVSPMLRQFAAATEDSGGESIRESFRKLKAEKHGAPVGHEFYGNQHQPGSGGGDAPLKLTGKMKDGEGGKASPRAKEKDALNELVGKGYRNPLNPREIVLSNEAAIEVTPAMAFDDGPALHIAAIRSFAPGTGAGSRALKTITDVADKHGITLDLEARGFGDSKLDDIELIKWYKRHGFVEDTRTLDGDSPKDYGFEDGAYGLLMRHPKGQGEKHGAPVGHEFYGNQHTGSQGGGDGDKSSPSKSYDPISMPDSATRGSIWYKPEMLPKGEDLVAVQHASTPKWLDKFMDEGVDATVAPPETNLGRATVTKSGGVQTSAITDPGLYVGPAEGNSDAVIIVSPAKHIDISMEAEGLGYKSGVAGLFGASDAIIRQKIDAKNVAGRVSYEPVAGSKWGKAWVWHPNPKSPYRDRFRVDDAGFVHPVAYKDEKHGAPVGHEFYGNQHTGSQGGGDSDRLAPGDPRRDENFNNPEADDIRHSAKEETDMAEDTEKLGAPEGHPFYGNQHTGGEGGGLDMGRVPDRTGKIDIPSGPKHVLPKLVMPDRDDEAAKQRSADGGRALVTGGARNLPPSPGDGIPDMDGPGREDSSLKEIPRDGVRRNDIPTRVHSPEQRKEVETALEKTGAKKSGDKYEMYAAETSKPKNYLKVKQGQTLYPSIKAAGAAIKASNKSAKDSDIWIKPVKLPVDAIGASPSGRFNARVTALSSQAQPYNDIKPSLKNWLFKHNAWFGDQDFYMFCNAAGVEVYVEPGSGRKWTLTDARTEERVTHSFETFEAAVKFGDEIVKAEVESWTE
jgi:hypothetical protein